ncbi:IclR family transcriptional regulator [Halalkalicoccus jeotgali]|nr:IclR family transcriptional regulator [Halalkalicoccus jeotgali]
MGSQRARGNEIGAVRKTLRILELLKKHDGARVTELSNELEWPKSTVHSHLETLKNAGYIVKNGDSYQLGFRFLDLGEHVKYRSDVYMMIEPRLDSLANNTGERVQFVISEHGDCVYARIAEGEHAVSTGSRLGRRRHMLHATAAGKSILAFTDREEVREIIESKGLPELTENTITNEDALFEELAEVRERGYAFNYEEHIEGLRAVAAPVQKPDGTVVGAISVSGPAHRMHGESFTKKLPENILGVCNEIELDIVYR